ncbi:hypothetical protein VNO77_06301 [Canavalia gladiata]|uniref:ABC transporter domain-containing protein n=1 Tax=Canavalia gladiata TaxID=3824 RepID=A0AAN9QV75_CANGL
MEGSDIYRASNSLRASSSTVWRKSIMEAFSRSSRNEEEDDEEALRWAALEKLPTYNRLRKGLLTTSRGLTNEIDIADLGFQERQKLLDRLINVAEEDNEKFLLKLKERIDRLGTRIHALFLVGIDIPTIEVRYENLNVEAEAYVGSRAVPTFLNFATNMVEGLFTSLHILSSKKKHVSILKDVSGIVKPSRMTLLLGPPSSGKTTLLLALSGKLDPNLKVSGRVTYNGHGMDEFVPQRTAAYISQHDVHIAEMTVRETLAFSARCQGVGTRYDLLSELSRREKEAKIKPDPDIDVYMKAATTGGQEANLVTDYVLKILGLDICADTVVGDEMLRGISGGQRKRVTTGEMLVGPANALFMDEISTGLDSSTTFQIVRSLKQYVHILNGTAVISLLQPAPETYELFDDIVLISDGQIVYQGPREYVLDFFEYMGFKCPQRKGVADFLQEVTSRKDQEQYWMRKDEPYGFVDVTEFSEAFQSFHVGRRIGEELAIPFDKSKNHPAALTTKKYGVNKKELLKANFSREYLLMKRNSFVYVFKLCQQIIMAILTMTLFLRTEMHRNSLDDGGVYAGALFFAVVALMFNGMAELSMAIVKLPIFYKQRDLLFFPSWAYAIPTWILRIPITFIEAAVWVFLTYYVIGFDPNFGSVTYGLQPHSLCRALKQYLVLLLINQMASGLFRAIAAIGRNMIVTNTFASFGLLVLFTLGGFILSRNDIKGWWIWGYWISPLMYGQNAIMVNEFLGKSWNHFTPNSNKTLGIQILESRGFFTDAYWYWIGIGALIGFIFLFNIIYTLALTCLNTFEKPQSTVTEQSQGTMLSNRTREDELTPLEIYAKVIVVVGSRHRKKRGMVLPFEPYSITFDQIVYSVDMPRNDIHSPHVTVYESLVYSAWLRLPAKVESNNRKMFIEEVMELVELNPLRNSLVGLPGVNGLSTEQRKRLTIAVELVANPSIIFMDEPTSGLDARAAAIVMRTVRNTVDTGRTVVCTIHQPSIDIFEAFDELFLMKRGGQEIYVGPLGRDSCQLIKYFESIEGVSKIKDGYNPATWMLEVTTPSQELTLGVDFHQIYKSSKLYSSSRQNLFNAIGSMYNAVLFVGVQNAASVQPVVAIERTVFYRERAAGMYSALPYAIAQVIIELPYIFVQAASYGVIVYAMMGFEWTLEKFFWYIFFMYFTLCYFTFYGMMAVAITPNHHVASIVGAAFYGIWNLFSGFVIPQPNIPVWWRWYYWACPVAWTIYGLVASQYGDVTDLIKSENKSVQEFIRSYFGIKHDFLGVCAIMVSGFAVLFVFIFALSVKVLNFQKR